MAERFKRLGDIPIEKVTQSVPTVDTNHAQIHEAHGFQFCHSKPLAAGLAMASAIVVPAGAYVHFQAAAIHHGGAIKLEILEDVTSYANGTPVLPSNKHRIRNTASLLTVTVDVDTIVGGSNLIDPLYLGSSGAVNRASIGGTAGDDSEWILAPATTYLFRVTSPEGTLTQNVAILPFWYEESGA